MLSVEWPGRCGKCGKPIEDWSGAGFDSRRWVHKTCYAGSKPRGEDSDLQSPLARSSQLEAPMLLSLLFFHFGLATAVVGWIMLTQDYQTSSDWLGVVLLVVGVVTPLLGILGVAFNVLSRRRIETVRQALELQGGWKPTR